MTIQVSGKDEKLKTVVEIDEKSKMGRFTMICMHVGFATLVVTTIKTVVKIVNKITKKKGND